MKYAISLHRTNQFFQIKNFSSKGRWTSLSNRRNYCTHFLTTTYFYPYARGPIYVFFRIMIRNCYVVILPVSQSMIMHSYVGVQHIILQLLSIYIYMLVEFRGCTDCCISLHRNTRHVHYTG